MNFNRCSDYLLRYFVDPHFSVLRVSAVNHFFLTTISIRSPNTPKVFVKK
jgi:hypothetical protein